MLKTRGILYMISFYYKRMSIRIYMIILNLNNNKFIHIILM